MFRGDFNARTKEEEEAEILAAVKACSSPSSFSPSSIAPCHLPLLYTSLRPPRIGQVGGGAGERKSGTGQNTFSKGILLCVVVWAPPSSSRECVEWVRGALKKKPRWREGGAKRRMKKGVVERPPAFFLLIACMIKTGKTFSSIVLGRLSACGGIPTTIKVLCTPATTSNDAFVLFLARM